MRRYLPVLFFGMSLMFAFVTSWLSQDVYTILRAVIPMITTSKAYAPLFAVVHVGTLVVSAFLSGFFLALIFVTKERKSNDKVH